MQTLRKSCKKLRKIVFNLLFCNRLRHKNDTFFQAKNVIYCFVKLKN